MNRMLSKTQTWGATATLATAVFSLMAAVAPMADAAGPVAPPPTLRSDGVGPVHLGMTAAEITAVLGRDTVKMPRVAPDAQCYYLRAQQYPEVGFMMADGVLRRIDLREPGMSTADGIRRGDTLAKVQATYGERLRTEPAATGNAKDWTLTVPDPAGMYATRIETREGFVDQIYAGYRDELQDVRPCS